MLHCDNPVRVTREPRFEIRLLFYRFSQPNLRKPPDEAFIIRWRQQFPVKPWPTDFQCVRRSRNQVLDVEDDAQLFADVLAVDMADTKAVRILRAGQPVNEDTQQTLLAYPPFYVENVEAERACHALRCLSNLSQFHSIPISIVSSAGQNDPNPPSPSSPSARCPKNVAPNKKVGSRPLARATCLEAPQYNFYATKRQEQLTKRA